MTLHGALSIIATVNTGREAALAALLQQIETDPGVNPLVPFAAIGSIHFARFVICPAKPDAHGNPIPCRLVFTTNYDQSAQDHLEELIQHAGPGLWKVFSHCDEFPASTSTPANPSAVHLRAPEPPAEAPGGLPQAMPAPPFNPTAFRNFLTSHTVKANTFYVGVGNRSRARIRQEYELRNDIQHFLDLNRSSLQTKDAVEIREQIRYFVSANPTSTWAMNPDPESTPAYILSRTLKLILAIVLFLLLSPALIPLLLVWVLIILYQELTRPDTICHVEKAHLDTLVAKETGIVQNQFSAFGDVKPGWFRYHTMVALLKLTDFLAPYLFSKGALSGIPTVHFARWLVISEGRQMLFLSNYDGNSEGYLKDFIDIAAKQLTLLFSHTVGYPKTRLMVFGGAKDANGFMAWARQNQLVTNVWYSANPSVSVKNVFQNSKIRNGLYGTMSERQARNWLRLF
jgi:hypothetical protein